MNSKEFIDYWDKTIKEWADSEGDIPESEKAWFEGNAKLKDWKDLIPEPYWGDPVNCSVVILNYNPACSNKIDSSCDGYIKNKEDKTTSCGLMSVQYSKIAKSFPILDKPLKCPFKCFGGVKWWQGREKWINQIIESSNPEILNPGLKPFALELCAWHSPSWSYINLSDEINDYLKTHIDGVLRESIRKAKVKIGLSVGKDFNKIFEELGYNKIKFNDLSGFEYIEENGYQPFKETERWYRIYQTPDGSYIINTHSTGSNQPPSKKFKDFEKKLIEIIKNKIHEKRF